MHSQGITVSGIPDWRGARGQYAGQMNATATAPNDLDASRAFEREVVGFAEQLRAFIRARISDPADAEDVAQEVFLKVFRGRGTLRDPAKLNAWLYRTARSTIIDHYRKRRPTEEVPATLAAESELPDDLAKRLQRSVRRFMATLPYAYRRPLELAEIEGLTARAVAAELGLTETAAKSRIARGRSMLREKLTQCCKFEFDPFGKIIDCQERAPCACGTDDPEGVDFTLATEKDENAIRALLAAAGLPVDDLAPAHFLNFFVARSSGTVIGCVGLEVFGPIGLLRSLAVVESYRGKGIARRLLAEIERLGRQLGVKRVFLLTTTARAFFERRGYSETSRDATPLEIRRTQEFAHLCPASAQVLTRVL